MNRHPLLFAGLLIFSASTLALESTRARPVAPYAQEQTVQTFSKTVHGGVQHVVVKAGGNAQVIKSVQAHLAKLAADFGKGDFSMPERMHGADMPGLAQLKKAKPDDIRFEYKPLENGAQIHYASEYPQYVQGLHEWFDAQTREHGGTVSSEHSQHHKSPAE